MAAAARTPSPLALPLSLGEVEQLTRWRRDLHAAPELSLHEHDTQDYVRKALLDIGFSPVESLGGTGLVVRLGRGDTPRCLLLRADMDALPVHELTGLPFASRTPGRMHACGHDGHMAILLAVARRMFAHAQEISGTVVFAFQPAEEIGRGALAMIEDGLLERPKVDHALGLHLWTGLPTGVVSAVPGPVMAAVDEFTVTVRGRGGHGALPHTAIDPIVAAAAVVQALQTIASRRTDPLDPVVVTVGSIHGGTAFNVVADEVVLRGTVRSFSKALAQRLPGLLDEVARAAAAAHGATAETSYSRHTIALHNDPTTTRRVAGIAASTSGVTAVDDQMRMMAGEDMAYILDRVPGCFFFVGCGGEGAEPHHSPRFRIDEAALPVGAQVMLGAVAAYFTDGAR
jgi:amidohydrolase